MRVITTGRTATAVTTMAEHHDGGYRDRGPDGGVIGVRRSARPASSVTTASASPMAATTSTTTTARQTRDCRDDDDTRDGDGGIPDRARPDEK
jgi:hypothetical protein